MDTKKLRQKVLDLAIHGKLVKQDPNDEPASILLDRIRKEKARLVGEGKIKKSDLIEKPISEEEIPFEIPEGWEWKCLSEIATFGGGKTPSMDNKAFWDNGTNLWVTSKDMKFSRITDSLMKITDVALSDMQIYEPGTLLMVTRSGILRRTLPLAILSKPATVNQDLKTISLIQPCLPEYIYITIKAQERVILKDYHKDGTTVDSINFDKFKDIPIPLPPLNEQHRIVKAVNELFGQIDIIEQSEKEIIEASDKVHSKVLNLAIQGRLVPQDPNDEPASVLLDKIRKEKERLVMEGKLKKKDLEEKPISPDEIPFDIPEGWEWCRLIDICSFLSRGKSPNYLDTDKRYPVFAQKCNLKDGGISLDQARFLDPSSLKKWPEEYTLKTGDVLVNSTGTGTVGRTRLFNENCLGKYPFVVPDSHVSVVRSFDCIHSEYLYYLMNTKWIQTYFEDNLAGSTNQKELYIDVLGKTPVPLPPLAEQRRIVEKIEEVLSEIEKLHS